jgi:hypothetical protein
MFTVYPLSSFPQSTCKDGPLLPKNDNTVKSLASRRRPFTTFSNLHEGEWSLFLSLFDALTDLFCKECSSNVVKDSFVPCIPQISHDLRTTRAVIEQVHIFIARRVITTIVLTCIMSYKYAVWQLAAICSPEPSVVNLRRLL